MGFFTMPQLVLAAGIGGDSNAHVLCSSPKEGCGEGPEGSIEASDSAKRAAVHQLIDG